MDERVEIELRQLCIEFLTLLDTLRNHNQINEDLYYQCAELKNQFLNRAERTGS
jgi:hypothetical protein